MEEAAEKNGCESAMTLNEEKDIIESAHSPAVKGVEAAAEVFSTVTRLGLQMALLNLKVRTVPYFRLCF